MVKLKKRCCTKKMVLGETLIESENALEFKIKKKNILLGLCFCSEAFGVTSFGLILSVCLINVMIFIQFFKRLVYNEFFKLVKDPPSDNFGYGEVNHTNMSTFRVFSII